MDSARITTEGLSVGLEVGVRVGALRYCDGATINGAALRALGGSLPAPGTVVVAGAETSAGAVPTVAAPLGALLAWRSPTETLVLCPEGSSSEVLSAVAAALEGALDACLVDQTGGIWMLRLQGPRVADLLRRLGATTAVPALGECRIGRLAEITVASFCVRGGEVLLLVERLYAEHLLGWIRETIADF